MKVFSVFVINLFLCGCVHGQNNMPDILGYGTEFNPGSSYIKIVYDLKDIENDDIKITLKISNNGGKNFLFPVANANGDVGFPVKPGLGKTITWYFPDTLDFNKLTSDRFIIKLIADDLKEFEIQSIVNMVDSARLRENLSIIQGVRHRTEGVQHLQEVKDLLWNKFREYWLYIEEDNFIYINDDGSTYVGQNIIGKKCGTYDETVFIILDGHFDSVGWSPGADDNGSAVTGVIEVARVLSLFSFEKNIRFIGFDLEEARIYGSNHYVENSLPEDEVLEGVLNFEMIGYYKNIPNTQEIPPGFQDFFPEFYQKVAQNNFKGDFAFNVANEASDDLRIIFDNCAAKYVPGLKVYSLSTPGVGDLTPDLRRSDHSRFWDAGYKAIMLNDGANYRNKNYHTENDVLDSLSFTFMNNIVRAAVGTIAELAIPIHGHTRIFPIKEYSVNTLKINGEEKVQLVRFLPNPIHGNAYIYYDVPEKGSVSLKIYNANGVFVKECVCGPHEIGSYESSIVMNNLKPGIYFYQYAIGNKIIEDGKIVFLNK